MTSLPGTPRLLGRTALYRIFGEADLLLYIGISGNFGSRWRQHAKVQPWWPEHRRMTVEWFPSRDEAEEAETAAIKAEKPKYNKSQAAYRERPADILPPLWEGSGDVLTQIERILTSGCRHHALTSLMVLALIEGHRELPGGQELEDLASKVHVSRANAYRLRGMIRTRSAAA